MTPKLEQVFTLRATLGKENALPLGSVRGGIHRMVAPVIGGFIKGPDIDAEILPGGGDWPLVDPVVENLYLDARLQARTSTGEMIYIRYPGESPSVVLHRRKSVGYCGTLADGWRMIRHNQDGSVSADVYGLEC